MGHGINLAKLMGDEESAKIIDNMKDQLIIVLVKKLGGSIDLSVSEMDDTNGVALGMFFDQENKNFHFEVIKSQ